MALEPSGSCMSTTALLPARPEASASHRERTLCMWVLCLAFAIVCRETKWSFLSLLCFEFFILCISLHSVHLFVQSCMRQTKKDWVVCRIFKKRAKMLEAGNTSRSYNDGRVRIDHVEFLDVQRSSSSTSSSSSSSCVTDLSSEEGEEGSSNGINASPPCGSLP